MLIIVATPIGNLGDITLRAKEILASCDYIVSENPMTTRKLLSKFEIHTPLHTYREDNHEKASMQIIEDLKKGKTVCLVSEAGTPSVSDPGIRLLQEVYKAKLPVSALPGASAVTTAISVFPIISPKFMFWGFLPRKRGEILQVFESWITTGLKEKMAFVCFESPYRLRKTLDYLVELEEKYLKEEKIFEVGIAQDLTKLHESLLWGAPSSIIAKEKQGFRFDKGECTMVATIKTAYEPFRRHQKNSHKTRRIAAIPLY